MSENKNIVIQQNNRTDYDKLHPEVYDKNVNLSTENASVWGNTLEDALPKIAEMKDNQWEIGDLRYTVKNDLGEKWLLCDGEVYSKELYVKLGQYIGTDSPCVKYKNQQSFPKFDKDNFILFDVFYYENDYYFVGKISGSNNLSTVYVSHGKDFNQVFSLRQVASIRYLSELKILVNQGEVGIIIKSTRTTDAIYFYFSSDLINWNNIRLVQSNDCQIRWCKVINDTWFLCLADASDSSSNKYDRIYYSPEAAPSMMPSLSNLTQANSCYIVSLDYVNNKYVYMYHNEVGANTVLKCATFSDLTFSDYEEFTMNWDVSGNIHYAGFRRMFRVEDGFCLIYSPGNPNTITNQKLYFSYSETGDINQFQDVTILTQSNTGVPYSFNNEYIVLKNNSSQRVFGASGRNGVQTFLPFNFAKIEGSEKIQLLESNSVVDLEYLKSTVKTPNLTVDKRNVYIKALD